ncbi:PREDICTED: uncharacterized protein LOC102011313 isoform X2 [Chinchilla lanigera]|uniref:uncharacterized protein LOC102011313 isoform X2 n=1 Tax=Chinchilla lanigera TaxID=34839 RepID=UPI0006985B3E|nr:PREDICTED: uncharacterized protein LOC102011313 isoform X2 [Chinchilla lanigera]
MGCSKPALSLWIFPGSAWLWHRTGRPQNEISAHWGPGLGSAVCDSSDRGCGPSPIALPCTFHSTWRTGKMEHSNPCSLPGLDRTHLLGTRGPEREAAPLQGAFVLCSTELGVGGLLGIRLPQPPKHWHDRFVPRRLACFYFEVQEVPLLFLPLGIVFFGSRCDPAHQRSPTDSCVPGIRPLPALCFPLPSPRTAGPRAPASPHFPAALFFLVFLRYQEPNSRPCACQAGAFAAELNPQPPAALFDTKAFFNRLISIDSFKVPGRPLGPASPAGLRFIVPQCGRVARAHNSTLLIECFRRLCSSLGDYLLLPGHCKSSISITRKPLC